MATLHVRNVPDELYERLRTQAARNGRSIGGEIIVMLEAMLAGGSPRSQRRMRRGRRERKEPFEHFSPRAREVVVDASEEARELGHDAIGTGHLLLGLLHETRIVIALGQIGVTLDDVRDAVVREAGRGESRARRQLPFDAAAKKAFEIALRESLRARCEALDPEHILLGVLDVDDALGARILAEYEPALERVRFNVHEIAANPSASLRYGVEQFRIVELEGTPEAWESQLNAAAERGFLLAQIIDRRAIFKRPW